MAITRALIFDYNGIIVDTDEFDKKAIKHACTKLRLPFSNLSFEKYFSGKSLADAAVMYLTAVKKKSALDEFVSIKKSFDVNYLDYIEPYTDTVAFIGQISKGIKLALVTGTRRVLIEQALKKLNLQGVFPVIVTVENYMVGKPHPQSYNIAVEQLGIPKKDTVAIEDHPLGVSAAKQAGLRCLAVARGYKVSELSHADWVVKELNYRRQSAMLGLTK